jgi:hypothetical protein
MYKMYTRYKYTAVPIAAVVGDKTGKQIKRNNNNTHTLKHSCVYL